MSMINETTTIRTTKGSVVAAAAPAKHDGDNCNDVEQVVQAVEVPITVETTNTSGTIAKNEDDGDTSGSSKESSNEEVGGGSLKSVTPSVSKMLSLVHGEIPFLIIEC